MNGGNHFEWGRERPVNRRLLEKKLLSNLQSLKTNTKDCDSYLSHSELAFNSGETYICISFQDPSK